MSHDSCKLCGWVEPENGKAVTRRCDREGCPQKKEYPLMNWLKKAFVEKR